ncbi:hypothetical protein WH47_04299, partial [Habropoda laboriosa]
MESAIACSKRVERRSTRSSTSKNRFSSRNTRSEAFYAGVEPLSVRRALHNSTGPDPDTNSAPNSSGSAERSRRHYTSGRPRYLDPGIPLEHTTRTNRLSGGQQELFHTVPRDIAVSRREILRRYSKEKEENPSKFSEALRHRWKRSVDVEKDLQERPRTLPSTSKRLQKEQQGKVSQTAQGFKKISRQDILRRRVSVDAPVGISRGKGRGEEKLESSEAKGGTVKSSSSFQKNVPRPRNHGWGKEDERESRSVCDFLAVTSKLQDITRGLVPRPSTLPKIIHHVSRSARLAEEWASHRLAKDVVRKEPPIYGRIRRRKTSLPSSTGTLRNSLTSLNTLSRYPKPTNLLVRERAVDVEFKPTTRHLRDPVPDTPFFAATLPLVDMRSNPQRHAIYAKVSRRTSKGHQSHDNKTDSKDGVNGRLEAEIDSGHRTMSRKRIIENMKENYGAEKNSSKTEEDSVEIQPEFQSESQSYQSKDLDLRMKKEQNEMEVDRSKKKSASGIDRYDSRSEGNRTKSKETMKNKSKSQSRLIENFRSTQREIGAATRLATTLPSYVKSSRKYSTESPPGIDCHRKLPKETGISSKQIKERSNYVKKSAANHVRAFSDANSARSNSPVTTSSIFGFCTGKRKVQSSSNGSAKVQSVSTSPTWNVKTVS